MSTIMKILLIALLSFSLISCAGVPGAGSSASTAQTPTQGAQTIGGSQGQAGVAETGAATAQIANTIINTFAAKTVTISKEGEALEMTMEGAEGSTVNVAGAPFMGVTGHGSQQNAETSSGGGSAGGVGDAVRTGGATTGGTASGTQQ